MTTDSAGLTFSQEVHMAMVEQQTVATGEYLAPPFKLSWGAVFGGTFVALGVWILLYALGAAAGLTAVDPFNPSSAKSAGIGMGIWYVIAPLIALFVGGMVGARAAGVIDRMGGAIHGAVIWGFTTVAGFAVVTFLLGNLLGAVFGLGGRALTAGGSAAAAGAQASPDLLGALGVSSNDLLGPVNQQLRNQGKPEVTAAQLQAVVRDVAPTAVRQGNVDREMIISSVTKNTQLSRQDAGQLADQLQGKLQAGKDQLAGFAGQAQTGALKAADSAGKALWVVFLALLLGLVSSVLGALVGVSREQRAEYARHYLSVPGEART